MMKKANWMMTALTVLALTTAVWGMTGCKSACGAPESKPQTSNTDKRASEYFCPMHPEVVQASQGKCPKCGMALSEKY